METEQTTAEVPAATPAPVTTAAAVESPPRPAVVEKPADDPRGQLLAMAAEAAKRGTRRLLWEYLRLRSRVVRK